MKDLETITTIEEFKSLEVGDTFIKRIGRCCDYSTFKVIGIDDNIIHAKIIIEGGKLGGLVYSYRGGMEKSKFFGITFNFKRISTYH